LLSDIVFNLGNQQSSKQSSSVSSGKHEDIKEEEEVKDDGKDNVGVYVLTYQKSEDVTSLLKTFGGDFIEFVPTTPLDPKESLKALAGMEQSKVRKLARSRGVISVVALDCDSKVHGTTGVLIYVKVFRRQHHQQEQTIHQIKDGMLEQANAQQLDFNCISADDGALTVRVARDQCMAVARLMASNPRVYQCNVAEVPTNG